MRAVVEVPSSRGASYVVNDDGVRSVIRTTCEKVEISGQAVAVFYDFEMNVLHEPSVFMLRKLGFAPQNTRDQAVSALKLLCSYSAVIGASVASFGPEEAGGFVRFARGSMGDSVAWSFRGLTRRSETAINAYLNVVRQYVKYLGLVDSPFLDAAVKKRGDAAGRFGGAGGYAISAHVPEELTAPPYVSRSEYAALKAVIGADGADANPAPLIIRLVFEHGLRIGEVLGVTLEDIQSELDKRGFHAYFLILRDRVCDRAYQRAKSVIVKPRSRDEYRSREYHTRNVGYHKVYISDDLYFAIMEYVEVTRLRFTEEQLAPAFADSVGGKWSMEGNQYAFLNTKGGRLSANLWNKRLRAYFAAAGIHVDEECRKTNLNHRLRHGFAMVLKRDLGVDDLTAKTLMRHRSLRSIQPYLLPTEDDVHEMYTTVIAGMRNLLLGDDLA